MGKADLMLSEDTMILNGHRIPLEVKSSQIKKVVLSNDVDVPPMTESLISVSIMGGGRPFENAELLIEPLPRLAHEFSVVMASTLVYRAGSAMVNVRAMNPFPNPIKLRKNVVIAEASNIEQIEVIAEQEDELETDNCLSVKRIKLREQHKTDQMSAPELTSDKESFKVPPHLELLFRETTEHFKSATEDETQILADLFKKYSDVFSKSDTDLGQTTLTEHVIETGGAVPIKQAPRKVPLAFAGEDQIAIEKLKKQGTIRESTSPWASPLVFVRKKNGQVRPCVDYRRLNAVTRKDAFPLPRTQDCLDCVAGAKLFSSMDITSGYNQIPVREEDIPKTAFVSKYGLFEYLTMPFGLCNAPATFQRVMELALAGLQWKTCLVYLDDVLVFSDDFSTHVSRLSEVLSRIQKANLKLKPAKCHFLQDEVVFLGHVISSDGITPNPENLEKIANWPTPSTVKEVQSFLGMANYYRRFVHNYSEWAKPLTHLIKKAVPFDWTDTCQDAFDKLKSALMNPPVMAHPTDDGLYILDTDACADSIGSVLSQIQTDGTERVIAYGSKTLSKTEKNYCVTDRELLAIRYFTEYYRCYLLGRKFLVRSDHQALKWLLSMKDPRHRIARWIEHLSQFDCTIEYRAGSKHSNADCDVKMSKSVEMHL